MQERVYRTPILDVANLKECLIAAWFGLQQHVTITQQLLNYLRAYSLIGCQHIVPTTRHRLPCWRCFPTLSVLPTLAVCQCWHFWICWRLLTQSTTRSSCAGCRLGGIVLAWFTSYLANRTQYIHCSKSISTTLQVLFGVPQGSVLRLILFRLYMADLVRLVESFRLRPHLYADDPVPQTIHSVALLTTSPPSRTGCDQTNFVWTQERPIFCGLCQHQLATNQLTVNSNLLSPVSFMHGLGIYVDADLSMQTSQGWAFPALLGPLALHVTIFKL